jgi:hypothetical protein
VIFRGKSPRCWTRAPRRAKTLTPTEPSTRWAFRALVGSAITETKGSRSPMTNEILIPPRRGCKRLRLTLNVKPSSTAREISSHKIDVVNFTKLAALQGRSENAQGGGTQRAGHTVERCGATAARGSRRAYTSAGSTRRAHTPKVARPELGRVPHRFAISRTSRHDRSPPTAERVSTLRLDSRNARAVSAVWTTCEHVAGCTSCT